MNKLSPVDRFYRARSKFRRNNRIIFPSPAEVRFIRLMGGIVYQVPFIRETRNGFPLAIVTSMGRILDGERILREVRVGRYYVDFGNDLKRGIEIDGAKYHVDTQVARNREKYIAERGWQVLHIDALALRNSPNLVQRQVIGFLLDGYKGVDKNVPRINLYSKVRKKVGGQPA